MQTFDASGLYYKCMFVFDSNGFFSIHNEILRREQTGGSRRNIHNLTLKYFTNTTVLRPLSRYDTVLIVFLIRMAILQLLPLSGARKRIVWHIMDPRSAVGSPHRKLVHRIVCAGRTRRTGGTHASAIGIIIAVTSVVVLMLDELHIRYSSSPRRSPIAATAARGRVVVSIVASTAIATALSR